MSDIEHYENVKNWTLCLQLANKMCILSVLIQLIITVLNWQLYEFARQIIKNGWTADIVLE